ncbi:hypothetical protein T492DRAFT_1093466 [Pavlovales sp. CCMP2436]|nr:hypothetical protein T492DRAFT_1093466 [Pavlovales sp. CCMP2436]
MTTLCAALLVASAALTQPPRAGLSRRELTQSAALTGASAFYALAGGVLPAAASLGTATKLEASWTSTRGFGGPAAQEGLVDASAQAGLIAFDESAYKAMASDRRRTPQFSKAIKERLAGHEGEWAVLDIGTGPYALLAILAAKSGARKVYAVEAVPEAARRARLFIAKAVANGDVKEGQIEVLDGLSTAVTLPEKVDLVIAEIIGTIASEESCYATIRDAQLRHTKRPNEAASWIPVAAQTIGSPCSYSAHALLGPPDFDWAKLEGAPVRLNCRETAVQILADPQLLEEIRFDVALPASGKIANAPRAVFTVDSARLLANAEVYKTETRSDGIADMAAFGTAVAGGLSGLALWPRLQLDEAGTIFVESRGVRGEPKKSHWTTAVVLLAPQPVPVKAGDIVTATLNVELSGPSVTNPPSYILTAALQSA